MGSLNLSRDGSEGLWTGVRRGNLPLSEAGCVVTVPKTVRGQIGALATVCAVVFLCVVPWSVWRLGSLGVLTTLVGAGCCLLPGCLLFLLQHRLGRGTLVVPLLVGVAARVASCLLFGGGLHVWWQVPLEPLVWVILAFYLAGLACETWVLSSSPDGSRAGVRLADSAKVTGDAPWGLPSEPSAPRVSFPGVDSSR